MQRDMELIRELLVWIEAFPAELPIRGTDSFPKNEKYQYAEIQHHLGLMQEAGLINALPVPQTNTSGKQYFPKSLTWAGHDFLDAARNDTVWNKVKNTVGPEFKTMGLAVLKEMLIGVAKLHYSAMLGIPHQ